MNQLNKILSLLLVSIFLFACEKVETLPDCEKNKTGTMTVSNNSTNPYDLYIDNVLTARLAGGTISSKFTVAEGNGRKFYVKQVSGFVLFPTEKTQTFNVVSCSDYNWQIP